MTRQRGTVRLVGRTWRLALRLSRDPGQKPSLTSVRLGTIKELPTKRAAREAADRWLDRAHPADLHAGSVLEWSRWCDRYIERCLPMLAKGSRTTQTSIVDRHLREAFSGPVHKITPEAVQEFLIAQRKAGAAPASIRARFAVLRRMLRQAAADGLAVTPVTAGGVTLPKDDRVHNAVRLKAFAWAEASRILENAADPDRLAYELALYLGLRSGEVLGLAWSAIDLETGAVIVRQQAVDGVLRPLKTKDSKATLRAPPRLLERLRAFHATWQANDLQLLFVDEHGGPIRSADLRARLHKLLEVLRIRRRGMHAWRHACALAMASAGCNPEVIRRAMRHSSLAITAIYLEAAPEDIAAGLEKAAKVWN